MKTPKYILNHILPHPVDKDKTEAKWDKEKAVLLVTVNNIYYSLVKYN